MLEDFIGDDVPPYAILSHTWGAHEISLQEFNQTPRTKATRQMAGFAKIEKCAEIAAEEGLQYAWADTCCIDKSSSAELSEAINSMYRWYQMAIVCYAYLVDVRIPASLSDKYEINRRVKNSRWFTRGWTLQELLAPRNVMFFSSDWQPIETKSALSRLIENFTGIPSVVLISGDLSTECIASRMSWAAERSTTRTEDMAYCLMGLFDVNMPMLYGEGSKAFLRLQEEIMRKTDDESIFAWRDASGEGSIRDRSLYRGLFASSPAAFKGLRYLHALPPLKPTAPFQTTSLGFSVEFILIPCKYLDDWGCLGLEASCVELVEEPATEYVAILNCGSGSGNRQVRQAILLERLQATDPAQFVRIRTDWVMGVWEDHIKRLPHIAEQQKIFVRQEPRIPQGYHSRRLGGFRINTTVHSMEQNLHVHLVSGQWDDQCRTVHFAHSPPRAGDGVVGALELEVSDPFGSHPPFHGVLFFGVLKLTGHPAVKFKILDTTPFSLNRQTSVNLTELRSGRIVHGVSSRATRQGGFEVLVGVAPTESERGERLVLAHRIAVVEDHLVCVLDLLLLEWEFWLKS